MLFDRSPAVPEAGRIAVSKGCPVSRSETEQANADGIPLGPEASRADPSWMLGVKLVRLGLKWRRLMDEELQSLGLTDATWRPLFHLGRLGDGLRQVDLADAMAIQGPSLVRLLDNLERDGLIERREDQQDRRAKIIVMTPAGRPIYEQAMAVAHRLSQRVLADVATLEVGRIHGALDTLATALDHLEDEAHG